jgi:hypothetical protein
MSKKRVEGSWHCKPWCTLHHKYPANEKRCSFDREHYSNHQRLKGVISHFTKAGYGCELKDTLLSIMSVLESKVKVKRFRLDKDFYKLSAGEQIKKLQKSL